MSEWVAEREPIRRHKLVRERNVDGPWLCPGCRKTKPKNQFGKTKDGRGTARCLECGEKKK